MPQELVGVALAGVAACCYESGYALQAIEARAIEARHALRLSLAGQLARRRRWLAGTALSLCGYPLQVAALTLAPLALVQPMLALGLLLLLAFGHFYLREPIGRRELAATAAIVAGVAAIAIAAPQRAETAMHGAGLAAVAAVLAAMLAAPWLQQAVRGQASPWALVVAAGAADAFAAIAAAMVAAQLLQPALALAALWALAAGATAGAGFLAEMSALRRLPATRVAPTVLVLQVVVPVVAARLAGGERWDAGASLVWAGLALLTAGVGLLAGSRAVASLRA